MSTKLLYLENMHDLEADAYVERVDKQDGRDVVYLDQTILYPQGGGQPYDTGVIQNEDTKFIVEEVRFVDGEVLHIGHFEGRSFIQGEDAHIIVDADRRRLNARLHSAGHVVDMAVSNLCPDWVPAKGYHFPDSPYVEYDGQFDPEKRDELMAEIERLGNEYVKQGTPVTCRFVEHAELKQLCRHVPTNIPTNKPIRVVQFDNFAVPCGGTHVKSLDELKDLTITKLKKKDKYLRVGYNVSR
jgi:Ser-tRNA(Ala) deacylase AlaX